MMKARKIWAVLFLLSFGIGVFAQGDGPVAKITDLKKVTTTVSNLSSSSSSSCGTSDFPIFLGDNVDIADLTWISVRHDLTPSDPNYIKLEMTFKDGTTGIHEMIRYIRFTGKSEEEDFSIMVKDINTIQILPSGY